MGWQKNRALGRRPRWLFWASNAAVEYLGAWGVKFFLSAVLLAVIGGSAGKAIAQIPNLDIMSLQTTGSTGVTYTTGGTVTAILSQPGAVNGIGGAGSSVQYEWAFDVQDSTGSALEVFSYMPSGTKYTPSLGDVIQMTGQYAPFHQIPEFDALSAISLVSAAGPGTLALANTDTATPFYLGPLNVFTVSGVAQDVAYNSVVNTAGTGSTTLPADLGGKLIQLNNVKITGAGTPGTPFGVVNSPAAAPNIAFVSDATSGTGATQFYYWPTSYAVANTNLSHQNIPSGYVNMVGIISFYAGSNYPEINPFTITPSPGPPLYWRPAAEGNTWDGNIPPSTTPWSTSSGPQTGTAGDASSNAATFDDLGLANGGATVNVLGSPIANAVVVSNSAGTYTFTGGTVTASLNKTGNGGLLLNNTLIGTLTVTAGTMGGSGTVAGSLTVGSGAILTPGTTLATVGQLTISGGTNSNADFSSGGTYLWKLGSSLVDTSSGTAGTSWDLLNATQGGYLNLGGSAQLALSFAGSASPAAGNAFWNGNHTWVIGSASMAPVVGGTILGNSYSSGTFSLQGDPANDLVLKFTSVLQQPRNLIWSASGSTTYSDGSGTWSSATWTDSSGTASHLIFDSTRPDNAAFGNPAGTGGSASVFVSGAVTVGNLTLNGGNAARYSLVGNANSILTVNGGITALGSASLAAPSSSNRIGKLYLGYSQTWDVASGTLLAQTRSGIFQSTVSGLTKTGSGVLDLACACKYTGGTTLSGGEIFVAGNAFLPQSGVVTTAAGTLLELNGNSQTIGALSGGGAIDLGSGATLSFGDTTNQTFSGPIGGSGSTLAYLGAGVSSLAGASTFSGSVSVGIGLLPSGLTPAPGGELLVSTDSALGNGANPVSIDNGNILGASASFSSSRAIFIGALNGVLDVVGTNNVWTVNGPITGAGTLSVNNPYLTTTAPMPGKLVLTNTNNNYAATVLSDGTLAISSAACVGSGTINFLGLADGSTMQFTKSLSMSNDMYFPPSGRKAIWFDTQGNNVTLTGNLFYQASGGTAVSINKTGSGTLTFAGSQPAGPYPLGDLYVYQGTVALVNAGPTAYSSVQSSNNITVEAGAALQFNNAHFGYQSNSAGNGSIGYVDLSSGTGAASLPGATLVNSGSSSYANGDIEVGLDYSTTNSMSLSHPGTAAPYTPSAVTIQTLSATDVLSIQNSVKQYDPGAGVPGLGFNGNGNSYANAVFSASANKYVSDPTKLVTIKVSGPGIVQLQNGEGSSDTTFGGNWSVGTGSANSGILEIGPYQVSNGWNGPYGQLLNALGFKTVGGQTYTGNGSVQGDPDIPNSVTVNSGGMFVVAVDQVNTNPNITTPFNYPGSSSGTAANSTPDYLRNPIILNGGALAASGTEASFATNYNPPNSNNYPAVSGTTTAVTATLGGDFTVSPGTSTIDTYDPFGPGPRAVQLLGGTRVLSNSTAAFAAGTVLTYSTTWAGTLNVDGGTAGGEFDLFRDNGGTVSVGSGALINIMRGATVNVGGTETYGTLYDETGYGKSLNFNGGAGGGHLVFSRTADTSLSYAGNISGALDLTQEGTDVLVLSGTNTYAGGTYVESGTLKIASVKSLPAGGTLVVGNGAGSLFDPASAFSAVADFRPASGVTAVPEPASFTLLLVAAGFAAGIRLRRRTKGSC
jgi:fibronectin-binding autotransporter adhesin